MGTSDVFQGLKIARAAGECKNITSDHTSRNARAIIRFFIYNILKKIIKKSRKRDRHASMDKQLCNGFQTAHMFYFNQSITIL